MTPPIIVVHEETALRVARAEVEAEGWQVNEGFVPRAASGTVGRPSGGPVVPSTVSLGTDSPGTDSPGTVLPGTVLLGTIDDEDSASAALIGLVRGHGVLALLAARDDVAARFLDDLLRFGRIDHRPETSSAAANVDLGGVDSGGVDPGGVGDDRIAVQAVDLDLLRLLGDGSTVTQASKALHISRRTANRRLIALRQAYGVATTAQLVSRSRSLGVIDSSDRRRG